MMDRRRTPDERFEGLSDFDFDVHFADVVDPTGGEALRIAYLDEGPRDGKVVVLLHGEPFHDPRSRGGRSPCHRA